MNQFSKFFALLGLSTSVALVGAGCATEADVPESELADDSAELAVNDITDENTAESEDALSSDGWGGDLGVPYDDFDGAGWGGDFDGAGWGGDFDGGWGGGEYFEEYVEFGGCDCPVDSFLYGRHFIRGPYYGPCGGYWRGYYGYGHPGYAWGHGRL
jgi:hypothetical protein